MGSDHQRTWTALVYQRNHQIDLINSVARKRQLTAHIVVYLVHLLEDLCQAAWCFRAEYDQVPEVWVPTQAMPFWSRAGPATWPLPCAAPAVAPAGGH